jgi:uncharacterized protein YebE (UPF0316 family)
MDWTALQINHPDLWKYAVIPTLICLARVIDVTIGTVRIVFLSKGMKRLAPFLGFFEVVIWLLAIAQVMKHMDSWINYIAYGMGFALGNYLGMVIEEKLSIGYVLLRIITKKPADLLIEQFRKQGLRLTFVEGTGLNGPVQVLFMIIRRKMFSSHLKLIRQHNPDAVYSVEDIRSLSKHAVVGEGLSPSRPDRKLFRFHRKGK